MLRLLAEITIIKNKWQIDLSTKLQSAWDRLGNFSRRTWFGKLILNAFIESSPHLQRFQSNLFWIVLYKPYHMVNDMDVLFLTKLKILLYDLDFVSFKNQCCNFYWNCFPNNMRSSITINAIWKSMLTEFNLCDLIFTIFHIWSKSYRL